MPKTILSHDSSSTTNQSNNPNSRMVSSGGHMLTYGTSLVQKTDSVTLPSRARKVALAAVAMTAVIVVVLCAVIPSGEPTELMASPAKSLLHSMHHNAAHAAARTAHKYRATAEKDYAREDADKLHLSEAERNVQRIKRQSAGTAQLELQAAAKQAAADSAHARVAALEGRLTRLTQQRSSLALKAVDAQRAQLMTSKAVNVDKSDLNRLSAKRASLLATAKKLRSQSAALKSRAKKLKARSTTEYAAAVKPGVADADYQEDASRGGGDWADAKQLAQQARALSEKANNDAMDASLLDGVPGYPGTSAHIPLEYDNNKLAQYGNSVTATKQSLASLDAKIAATRAKLKDARIEAQSGDAGAAVAGRTLARVKALQGSVDKKLSLAQKRVEALKADESKAAAGYTVNLNKAQTAQSQAAAEVHEMEEEP